MFGSEHSARQGVRELTPKMKQVVAAIITRDSDERILICQRRKEQALPLKWEFPGGKIEAGEQPVAALKRELEEELGIDAEIGEELTRFVHNYKNGGGVELTFFRVRKFSGEITNRIFRDVRWVTRDSLPQFDFLEADLKLIREIADGRIL